MLSVTIAAKQALSTAVDLRGLVLFDLVVLSQLDSGQLITFQVSDDTLTFADVYDPYDNELVWIAAAGRAIVAAPDAKAPIADRSVRLRSGSVGAPVNQVAGERILTLHDHELGTRRWVAGRCKGWASWRLAEALVEVTPIGCGLPPVNRASSSPGLFDLVEIAPRRFTLKLTSKRRDTAAAALRSSLLPFWPAGGWRHPGDLEVGLVRTLELTAYYRDGLEELGVPAFIAPSRAGRRRRRTDRSLATFNLVGTASSRPTLTLTGGAGTVTAIGVMHELKKAFGSRAVYRWSDDGHLDAKWFPRTAVRP